MRAIICSLLGILLVSCGGGGSDGGPKPMNYIDYPPLWNDYKVGLGETINLAEYVAIEFVAVEEDTRCLYDARCTTPGNARILLKCITPRGASLVRLNTSSALPFASQFDYYGVQLRTLEPNRQLDAQGMPIPIPPNTYEATLFVTKEAEPPPSP